MKLSPDNNLAVRSPELASEWDHEANGGLRPHDVTPGSNKKAGWVCAKGHRWRATVANRSRGNRCPVCRRTRGSANYNLALQRPDLASEWDHEANGDLRPEDVTPASGKKVGWTCAMGHRWRATVNHRFNGSGCPECSGRRVGPDNNLAVRRPDLASEWDYEANGDLRPQNVTPGADRKVWWRCVRGHCWQVEVFNRSKGSGCPVCAGQRVSFDIERGEHGLELRNQRVDTKSCHGSECSHRTIIFLPRSYGPVATLKTWLCAAPSWRLSGTTRPTAICGRRM